MITPPVPVAIDHDRLLKIFVDILSVDSYWGNEDRVVAILQPMLEDVGVVCSRDEIGNLIGKWPAKGKQTRPIMLNAHMDTVQPTPDMRPVVKADGVYSDGSSVLGADDKAGVAVIVEAVLAVHDAGLGHGPIELVFTVGEDVGQFGADAFDPNDIDARVAFVLDAGGPVGDLVTRNRPAPMDSKPSSTAGPRTPASPRGTGSTPLPCKRARWTTCRWGRSTTLRLPMSASCRAGRRPTSCRRRSSSSVRRAAWIRRRSTGRWTPCAGACEDAAAAFGGRVDYTQRGRFKATQFDDDHPAIQLADRAIAAAGLEAASHLDPRRQRCAELQRKGHCDRDTVGRLHRCALHRRIHAPRGTPAPHRRNRPADS